MHSKVFVKLKKNLKPSPPGKKTQKNPKKPKKPKKKQKNPKKPTGLGFLKKPGFFPTLTFRLCNFHLGITYNLHFSLLSLYSVKNEHNSSFDLKNMLKSKLFL
jgi:hypothetical protein